MIGSGNIGSHLMIKVVRLSENLERGPWSASTVTPIALDLLERAPAAS